MKKMKLLKSLLILFVAISFSNCEEDGPIQIVVADNVPVEISVKGLANSSSYTTNSLLEIGEIKDKAGQFMNLNVESVTLTLQDYSGTSISGNVKVDLLNANVVDEDVVLTNGIASSVITIPSGQSNILSQVASGQVPISINLTSSAPLGDDDFKVVFTFRVKGQGEL